MCYAELEDMDNLDVLSAVGEAWLLLGWLKANSDCPACKHIDMQHLSDIFDYYVDLVMRDEQLSKELNVIKDAVTSR